MHLFKCILHALGVTILFVLATTAAHGQNCNFQLTGQVTDEHDGSELGFATIYIVELERGAVADSLGNYKIQNLCAGNYTVRCEHIGCQPLEKQVQVNASTQLNFEPEHHSKLIPNYTVVGEKESRVGLQTMETLDAEQLHLTYGASLGQQLSEVNGVSTLKTGNNIAKPVIHGLHSNRILMLNNGVRQEGQQWGNEHAPAIDPFIADQLTVVKGANTVRYGSDGIAGVVLVQPRELPTQVGLGGEINLVGISNGRQGVVSGILEGTLPNSTVLRWRVQGTAKRGGNVHAPDYYLKNTGSEELNFSAGAAYVKPHFAIEVYYSQFNNEVGIFSGAHIGNLSDLQAAFEAEEPLEESDFSYEIGRPYQSIRHDLLKAKGYWWTSDKSKLSITYARQFNTRLEYDKDLPLNDSLAALNLPALEFNIRTQTVDAYWEKKHSERWQTTIGVQTIEQQNTYKGRYFIPNFQKYAGGVYAISEWAPDSSDWKFEAGLRYDVQQIQVFRWINDQIVRPVYDYSNVSASGSALYEPSSTQQWRLNVGTAWRPPHVSELYSDGVHHGAAAVERGDTTLGKEQAYSATLSYQLNHERWQINADVFNNYISNFIYLKPELPPTLTIRGAFPTFVYAQTNAMLYGADLTVRYAFPKRWEMKVRAALLVADNLNEGEAIAGIPAQQFGYAVRYAFADSGFWSNAFCSIDAKQVLTQSRVEPNSDFIAPPEGYALVNAQIGIKVPLRNNLMSVGLSVNNLLNTSYRDYLNRFRYYADDLGRSFTLRLSIPFYNSKTH